MSRIHLAIVAVKTDTSLESVLFTSSTAVPPPPHRKFQKSPPKFSKTKSGALAFLKIAFSWNHHSEAIYCARLWRSRCSNFPWREFSRRVFTTVATFPPEAVWWRRLRDWQSRRPRPEWRPGKAAGDGALVRIHTHPQPPPENSCRIFHIPPVCLTWPTTTANFWQTSAAAVKIGKLQVG